MPRPRVKPREPETGEPLEVEQVEEDPLEGKNPNLGKHHRGIAVKLAEERLRRLKAQNKKLALEYKEKTSDLVDFETIKRQVLAANITVKNQVLAVIERANVSRETKLALKHEMIQALNDLAYEHAESLLPSK